MIDGWELLSSHRLLLRALRIIVPAGVGWVSGALPIASGFSAFFVLCLSSIIQCRSAASCPIGWIWSLRHRIVKRRITADRQHVDNMSDQSVLHRIKMNIIEMRAVISFVADCMFPEPPSPNSAFAFFVPAGRAKLALRHLLGKSCFNRLPTRRESEVIFRQRPEAMHVVRQCRPCADMEGCPCPHLLQPGHADNESRPHQARQTGFNQCPTKKPTPYQKTIGSASLTHPTPAGNRGVVAVEKHRQQQPQVQCRRITSMRTPWRIVSEIAMFLLMSGLPSIAAPSIAVMPGAGKTLAQFQSDDSACLSFAQNQTSQAAQAAKTPKGTIAKTTIGGTAAGALFGAAGGNAGKGAAIGAGVGLVGGSVRSARQSNQSAQSVQRSYDIAYAQCMQTKGNSVPPGAFN